MQDNQVNISLLFDKMTALNDFFNLGSLNLLHIGGLLIFSLLECRPPNPQNSAAMSCLSRCLKARAKRGPDKLHWKFLRVFDKISPS